MSLSSMINLGFAPLLALIPFTTAPRFWLVGATPLFRGPISAVNDGMFQPSDSSKAMAIPAEGNLVTIDIGIEVDKSNLMASEFEVENGFCRSILIEQIAHIVKGACDEDDLCFFDINSVDAPSIYIKEVRDLTAFDFSDLAGVKPIQSLFIDVVVSVTIKEREEVERTRQKILKHLKRSGIDLGCS